MLHPTVSGWFFPATTSTNVGTVVCREPASYLPTEHRYGLLETGVQGWWQESWSVNRM